MKRILFVCHGNICRSVMAEYILKDLVRKAGLSADYLISSCATSREEIGNDIYPLAKLCLDRHGISYAHHCARQITLADYDRFDEILCMEHYNLRNLERVLGSDILAQDRSLAQPKIRMLLSHNVADPWYTGDFEATYRDVVAGCEKIMKM